MQGEGDGGSGPEGGYREVPADRDPGSAEHVEYPERGAGAPPYGMRKPGGFVMNDNHAS